MYQHVDPSVVVNYGLVRMAVQDCGVDMVLLLLSYLDGNTASLTPPCTSCDGTGKACSHCPPTLCDVARQGGHDHIVAVLEAAGLP